MGSAVTMGKAWHAHAMRPYLYRHNSPNFFCTLGWKEGRQPGAPKLWCSCPGSMGQSRSWPPSLSKESSQALHQNRQSIAGLQQQTSIIPGHRRDVRGKDGTEGLVEIPCRRETFVTAAPPLPKPAGL